MYTMMKLTCIYRRMQEPIYKRIKHCDTILSLFYVSYPTSTHFLSDSIWSQLPKPNSVTMVLTCNSVKPTLNPVSSARWRGLSSRKSCISDDFPARWPPMALYTSSTDSCVSLKTQVMFQSVTFMPIWCCWLFPTILMFLLFATHTWLQCILFTTTFGYYD